MIIGRQAISAAAISSGKLEAYCPCIFARPAESVVLVALEQTIIGHIRSLKAKTAVKMDRETIALRVSGAMISRKRFPSPIRLR